MQFGVDNIRRPSHMADLRDDVVDRCHLPVAKHRSVQHKDPTALPSLVGESQKEVGRSQDAEDSSTDLKERRGGSRRLSEKGGADQEAERG